MDLSPVDQGTVQAQNSLAKFALEVIRVCAAAKVPVGLENPATSLFWQVPEVRDLLYQSPVSCQVVDTDYCQWGARGMTWGFG